jgi:hypothetical protein
MTNNFFAIFCGSLVMAISNFAAAKEFPVYLKEVREVKLLTPDPNKYEFTLSITGQFAGLNECNSLEFVTDASLINVKYITPNENPKFWDQALLSANTGGSGCAVESKPVDITLNIPLSSFPQDLYLLKEEPKCDEHHAFQTIFLRRHIVAFHFRADGRIYAVREENPGIEVNANECKTPLKTIAGDRH